MRWSATLGTWARREAVLVAALAVAVGIAVLAGPLHAPWLMVAGAVVALLGLWLARWWLSVRRSLRAAGSGPSRMGAPPASAQASRRIRRR